MNYYLKTFFIIYLLLFTFASNSVAQETASRETLPTLNSNESDVCFDFMVDVRPPNHQIRNLWGLVEGYQIDIPSSGITRLELLFSVAQPEYPEEMVLGTIGIGKARNFQADRGVLVDNLNVPFGFGFVGYSSERMISDVVQEAVRDGYEKLRDLGLGYESKQRRPIGHVRAIQGDEFLVPLGRLDHIQDDDVFYVYSRGDYNACSSDVRGLALARARVVRMDDTSAILQINVALGGSRYVQVGDVVELSPEIDLGDDSKPRRPISYVRRMQGDRILVPLGRLDHIQNDDIFYVYHPDGYNAYPNTRSDDSPLALARATVVMMDDTSAILQINVALGGSRYVQVGDVVELSREIDFASRLQAKTDFRARQAKTDFRARSVLQFDVPNIYAFNDRGLWINVTANIKHFLVTEASGFGFRAVIKEE